LDEDVARKLTAEARKSGRSFRDIVNESLRLGLNPPRQSPTAAKFRVKPKRMGLRPGRSLDSVEALLDEIDGVSRR
jgi:hypothetical protein